ncbi:MAG: leucine-rich repeat protein [Firmicutes bacterium]|nr:leucine-rich repeat protein [Bacillota bacterium]
MKTKKNRLLCLILAFVLCVVMLVMALPVNGYTIAMHTWSYGGFTYSLSIVGTYGSLTISGTGDMPSYFPYKGDYYSYIRTVKIESGVTSIAANAFAECTALSSVTIPDTVTEIGSYAFASCTSLTSITIPDSVTTIGSYAFFNCSGLTKVTIPDGVTSIGESAFRLCTSLTSVTIPEGVSSIGSYAFNYCSSLKSVTIPRSVTSIEESAFYGTNISSVYYDGTEIDWNKISIESNNDKLTSATKYFGNLCDITFDLNCSDADTSISTQTVYAGSTVTEPTAPTRTGYTFDGWYTVPE